MGRLENAGSDFPLMGPPAKAGSALVLERLHALLKQKEGELTNLQVSFELISIPSLLKLECVFPEFV